MRGLPGGLCWPFGAARETEGRVTFTRYAIYFTPPPGPLAAFGASWLGWDTGTGQPVAYPDIAGLPCPVAEITETPGRYGLHATIKPPFRLAGGCCEADLIGALEAFCAQHGAATAEKPELARMGRFLALVPADSTGALNGLAAAVVRDLDGFRAPPGEAELARRRKAGLSARQERHLLSWGYPYVMEDFRFHITLTGRLPKSQIGPVKEVLTRHFGPLLPDPFVIDGLSLMGEDATGRFHLIRRCILNG